MDAIEKLNKKSFKINYFSPIWKLFKQSNVKYVNLIFVVFLSILVACCEALFIWLLAPFTNSVINKDQVKVNEFGIISTISNSPFLLLLFLILTLFLKSSLNTFTNYYVTRIKLIIRKKLRIKLIESVLHSSWKSKLEGAKLIDAYINSSTTATNTIVIFTVILTNSFYVIAILITFLLKASIDLIIVFIFLGVFYYLVVNFLSKKAQKLSFNILNINQHLSKLASEVIRGKRELQIYGFQKILLNQINDRENILVDKQSIAALLKSIPSILPSLLITLIIVYGYFYKDPNNLNSSAPIIVTSLVAVQRLGLYLSLIGQKLTAIRLGSAEIDYLLRETKSTIKGKYQKINFYKNKSSNTLAINNLTFNYGQGEELLKDLNLKFRSGKVSMILGPSGSGKSSFLSLLLKECSPIKGNIKINDYFLRDLENEAWYQYISLVPQSPFIFGNTILNNIKVGKSNASFDEIKKAVSLSGAKEFIDNLQNNFDFFVDDDGSNLSGGQCQLISLTRAILKDSPIILLDEPSNNLDKKSVVNLKKILLYWATKNKIILVITHDQRLLDKDFDLYKVSNFNLLKQEKI